MTNTEIAPGFTATALPTTGPLPNPDRDQVGNPAQPGAVVLTGEMTTPEHPDSGVALDADDQVPDARANPTPQAIANLVGATLDETTAAAMSLAKSAFDGDTAAIEAFMKNAPTVEVAGGRLHASVEASNAILSGVDLKDDTENHFNSKRIDSLVHMAMQPVQLKPIASTTSDVDPTSEAAFVAAAVGQAFSGKNSVGITASRLLDNVQEKMFRERIEPLTGRQHQAALVPIVASILGWLMHIGKGNVMKSRQHWIEQKTDFSISGLYFDGDYHCLDRQAILALTLCRQEGAGASVVHDEAGRMSLRTTYAATALAHDPTGSVVESELNGRYLLAIPKESKALTAAAVALTAGMPNCEAAIGHGALMSMASAAGVGYLMGVEGTENKVDASTPFGRTEMTTLLGFALRAMSEGDESVQQYAILQVAGLFRPSLDSAHDYTDCFRGAFPVISRKYNEAAFRTIWREVAYARDFKITKEDTAAGERALRMVGEHAMLNCIGVATSFYCNVMMNPVVVIAGDTKSLQADMFATLYRTAFDVTDGAAGMEAVMRRMTNKVAVPLNYIAALGLGVKGKSFTPANCPFPVAMYPKFDGVFYKLADDKALRLYRMNAVNDTPNAVLAALNEKIGRVATMLGGNNVITATQACGGVVAGRSESVRSVLGESLIMKAASAEGMALAVWNALVRHALVSTDTVFGLRSEVRADPAIDALSAAGAVPAAARAALGVKAVGMTPDAKQMAFVLGDEHYEMSGRPLDRCDIASVDPYGQERFDVAALAKVIGMPLAMRVRDIIGQIRMELLVLDQADDGEPASAFPGINMTAAAIGIVPQSVVMALSLYGQCTFADDTIDVIAKDAHGLISIRAAGDKVMPGVKSAVLAVAIGSLGGLVHVNNKGGQAATVGTSIVGTATYPVNLIPWSARAISIKGRDDVRNAVEAATQVTGQLAIKARGNPTKARGGTPLYIRNKTFVNMTSSSGGSRMMPALGDTATGVRAKNVPGPLAQDYREVTGVTAAGVLKHRAPEDVGPKQTVMAQRMGDAQRSTPSIYDSYDPMRAGNTGTGQADAGAQASRVAGTA